MDAFFESPPMKIGKHEWRVVVRPSLYSGDCIEYQFRQIGDQPWRCYRDWPSYNFNDGTWGGLPRSLRKLYLRHEAELKAWLEGKPEPQGSLAL